MNIFIILIAIGVLIFLTPLGYGSEHHMDDPIHFLFHGWGIVLVALALYYRNKLEKVK
tara:strand:- start:54 stop:227 length:174 start_codon:yes stop_codon:yes gene_type:complete